MVYFSEIQQFLYFLETFPGNFHSIFSVAQFSEFFVEWKAAIVWQLLHS